MPIEMGDNPEDVKGLNKFVGEGGSGGYRGLLLARNDEKTRAVMLGLNGRYWGRMVLVEEDNPKHYPTVAEEVVKIPDSFTMMVGMNDTSQ